MQSNKSSSDGKKVGLLGVPLGYGAGQTGSELGVEAIRLSRTRGGLLSDHIEELGYDVTDYGNVDIVRPQSVPDAIVNPKYLDEMVASCKNISADVRRIL